MPPVAAAVITCARAKLVTLMSRTCAGRCAAELGAERVARVLDHLEAVRVGDGADAIPVGAVADQVRHEDRLRARRDHLLDAVDVDVERVGLHVDERGHETPAHERRDVGGERDRRGDHLVAGLAPEQLDREVERRRTGVDHDPAALAEVLGDALLERLDVLADAQRARPAAQHLDDGFDLFLVVDAARVLDPALVGSHDSYRLRVEVEHADGVVAQELRPHVVAERHVRHLGEDALEAQAHRVVARVHDLVGAARVGVLDDRLGVVLGRERARHVVQVRPLEHELHRELFPRLGAVTHHDAQLGEVVTDLVEQHHVLALRREARSRDPGVGDDRDVEVDALLVDRVVATVVDRHLRVAAGGERRERLEVVLRLVLADLAHRAGDVVGVDLEAGDEATGVALLRLLGQRTRADEPHVDAPLVHLADRDGDAVVALVELVGHVLEHVARGELLGGLVVTAGRLAQVVVGLRRVRLREADHQVDGADVGGHGHAELLTLRNWMSRKSSTRRVSNSPSWWRSASDQRPSVSRRCASSTSATRSTGLAAGERDRDGDDAAVGGVGRALDEAELLEPADLPAGRCRVHPGGAGEVAEGGRTVLVDAAQQRVGRTGEVDPRRRGQPRVPVATGPEPVELLQPPLDRGHVVHRATLTYLLESSNFLAPVTIRRGSPATSAG